METQLFALFIVFLVANFFIMIMVFFFIMTMSNRLTKVEGKVHQQDYEISDLKIGVSTAMYQANKK